MEQRLANAWHMTMNEKNFIKTALLSDLRVDGRQPFDYRRLTITFGREDGSSEVYLGQTQVMAFVTAQLVQPYRDRPNEGSFTIYTEFSPMSDPSSDAAHLGEFAIELGRIIDRGLRQSRAVDTESLCVLAGKLAWSIRIDLHILDNGGNLIDAANIAALAALLTFRRPECTLDGEDGQGVIVHPHEVREPLPLTIHHLPIAVTFAFYNDDNIVVIDPNHYEEAVMKGRMTATVNSNGDVCAVQKAGGVGIMQSVVMRCLRIASVKAGDMTSKIKSAVESYNSQRAFSKIKRHPSFGSIDVTLNSRNFEEEGQYSFHKAQPEQHSVKPMHEGSGANQRNDMEITTPFAKKEGSYGSHGILKSSRDGLFCWDPYSEGVNSDYLKVSLASHGSVTPAENQIDLKLKIHPSVELSPGDTLTPSNPLPMSSELSEARPPANGAKSLKDAVKPKNRRKKKASNTNTS